MGSGVSVPTADRVSLNDAHNLISMLPGVDDEWKSDIKNLVGSWVEADLVSVALLKRLYDSERGGCRIDSEFLSNSLLNTSASNLPVKWVPSQQLQDSPSFDNLSYKSIQQGSMGDCFLVASLAALLSPHVLSKHGNLLNDIIKAGEGVGVSNVRIFEGNEATNVEVDSFLPLNGGLDLHENAIFASSPDTPIFSLIEKAFAKHFNGFWRLQGGNVEEAMVNLTGCPVDDIHFNPTLFKKSDKIRSMIMNNLSAGNPMCCGNIDVKLKDDSTFTSLGVTINHAFAIVKADKNHVWLYNPHGNDSHFKHGDEDGEIRLSWNEFGKNINRLQVAYLGVERIGHWKRKHSRDNSGGATNFASFKDNEILVLNVEDVGEEEMILMFGQDDMRGNRKLEEKLSYKEIGIIVVGIKKGEGGEEAVRVEDFNMLTPERYTVLAKTEAFTNTRDTCLRVSKGVLKGHKMVGCVFSFFEPCEGERNVWVSKFGGGGEGEWVTQPPKSTWGYDSAKNTPKDNLWLEIVPDGEGEVRGQVFLEAKSKGEKKSNAVGVWVIGKKMEGKGYEVIQKPTYVKAIVSSVDINVREVGTEWKNIYVVPAYFKGSRPNSLMVEFGGGGELMEIGVGPVQPGEIGKEAEEKKNGRGGKKKKGKKGKGGFDQAMRTIAQMDDLYANL